MTRTQLLANLSSRELMEWRVFYKVEKMEHDLANSKNEPGETIPIKHGRPSM